MVIRKIFVGIIFVMMLFGALAIMNHPKLCKIYISLIFFVFKIMRNQNRYFQYLDEFTCRSQINDQKEYGQHSFHETKLHKIIRQNCEENHSWLIDLTFVVFSYFGYFICKNENNKSYNRSETHRFYGFNLMNSSRLNVNQKPNKWYNQNN